MRCAVRGMLLSICSCLPDLVKIQKFPCWVWDKAHKKNWMHCMECTNSLKNSNHALLFFVGRMNRIVFIVHFFRPFFSSFYSSSCSSSLLKSHSPVRASFIIIIAIFFFDGFTFHDEKWCWLCRCSHLWRTRNKQMHEKLD